jgi:hypothetical protein
MSLNRLHRWYQLSSAREREDGISWYARAREHIAELAERHGVSSRVAAGVVATLSPNTRWERNLEDADSLLYAVRHASSPSDYYELTVTTYNANKLKAWSHAETGDVAYIRGPKVTAFYYNLIGNEDALTLDSHAMNAYLGARVYGSDLKTKPRVSERDAMLRAYKSLARHNGITPAGAQAVIWLYWKNRIDSGMVQGYE